MPFPLPVTSHERLHSNVQLRCSDPILDRTRDLVAQIYLWITL
ncbi:Uncharacterised protein [Vibrio cholerae]|nr:Uncharacterised protein [Vibrio cholerae]